MRAIILAFASLRDILGSRQEIDVEPGTRLGVLVDGLVKSHPTLAPRVRHLRYAANEMLVATDYMVQDGDEIALMPPTSGG